MNTTSTTNHGFPLRQRGAALFMALMFLIIITMLSLAAMRSSIMELRMAGNAESQVNAVQRAQAIIDATVAEPDNTPVIGGAGDTTCLSTASGCTRHSITFDDAQLLKTDIDADYMDVVVRRIEPLEKAAPRTIGTSAAAYSYASFEVHGRYDARNAGMGSAEVVEGVMVLISK